MSRKILGRSPLLVASAFLAIACAISTNEDGTRESRGEDAVGRKAPAKGPVPAVAQGVIPAPENAPMLPITGSVEPVGKVVRVKVRPPGPTGRDTSAAVPK